MADTNTYNKYNQPKKVLSQTKFDAIDKTDIPVGAEYDVVGQVTEGDLDSGIITKINNNAKINTANTFTQQQNFNKGIVVDGDITLNGETVKVTTAELYVKDKIIHTRDGANVALGTNEYTGIQATKYDGEHDGQLVFDKDGVARVGDVNDTQPLTTRAPARNTAEVPTGSETEADLQDNHLVKWNMESRRLIDSGKTIADLTPPTFSLDGDVLTITLAN